MRSLVVLLAIAACGEGDAVPDASYETLVGHWTVTPNRTCYESESSFDVLANRTIMVSAVYGQLVWQSVNEPAAPGAAKPSVAFSTHLVIGGEGGYVDRDVRLWLLDGAGNGTLFSNLGSCDATAARSP